MRIQTYSPFQTIISSTEGFYLIYHHFLLNYWLATEGFENPLKNPKICAAHTIFPQNPTERCALVHRELIVLQEPRPSARILETKKSQDILQREVPLC